MRSDAMRLSLGNLGTLPEGIALPNYRRAMLKERIVHIGIGAFHRAHQAWYTHTVLNRHGGDWGIVGVSLRSRTMSTQLNPQQGLYSLAVKDGMSVERSVIGSVLRVIYAPEAPAEVLALLAGSDTAIISLTITEKGYYLRGDDLMMDHPDIYHDLAHPATPRTAIGYLAAAIADRASRDAPPITIISCDNIDANGHKLRQALRTFLEHSSPQSLGWLEHYVRFPCTVVDRIVPATTVADRADFLQQTGLNDAGLVVTEPFSEWIIEDNFAADRPLWEYAGARVVAATGPYEQVKLQLLNASHSALACLGTLCGYTTVAQAMADPIIAHFIKRMMLEELAPSICPPPDFDVLDYCEQLLKRFANTALEHQLEQIAMDSSSKIPLRWLPALRHYGGEPTLCPRLIDCLAAWMFRIVGHTDAQHICPIDDPLADRLLAIRRDTSNAETAVRELLDLVLRPGTDDILEARLSPLIVIRLRKFRSHSVKVSL